MVNDWSIWDPAPTGNALSAQEIEASSHHSPTLPPLLAPPTHPQLWPHLAAPFSPNTQRVLTFLHVFSRLFLLPKCLLSASSIKMLLSFQVHLNALSLRTLRIPWVPGALLSWRSLCHSVFDDDGNSHHLLMAVGGQSPCCRNQGICIIS